LNIETMCLDLVLQCICSFKSGVHETKCVSDLLVCRDAYYQTRL